jgi:hypothetical protein
MPLPIYHANRACNWNYGRERCIGISVKNQAYARFANIRADARDDEKWTYGQENFFRGSTVSAIKVEGEVAL